MSDTLTDEDKLRLGIENQALTIRDLRALNAALVAALEKVAEDTGSPDAIDAIALAKGDKP